MPIAFSSAVLIVIFLAGVVQAATWHVDNNGACSANPSTTYTPTTRTSGSGSATCYPTINAALPAVNGGDTVAIHAGTYAETINFNVQSFPGGSDWTSATRIQAYGDGTAQMNGRIVSPNASYIIYDGLVVNGAGPGDATVGVAVCGPFQRFTNGEIRNHGGQGVEINYGCHDNEILNSSIHDNGTSNTLDHGFYIRGPDNLVENNIVYNNAASGIQFYTGNGAFPTDGNIVRYNIIHTNGLSGSTASVFMWDGDSIQFYGNVIYNMHNGISVHASANSANNIKIYNNTFYDADNIGIDLGNTNSAEVKNNIFSSVSNPINTQGGTVTPVFDQNFCEVSDTGCDVIDASGPDFVNAAAQNFQLLGTSPAINVGTATGHPLGTTFNGAAWDIGAHETIPFASATVENATPSILTICHENNVLSPLLPASGCAVQSAGYATSVKTITACARNSGNGNCMDLTVTPAFVNGEVETASYALTGDVSDNGGLVATEPLAFTGQAITNNVIAGETPGTGAILRNAVIRNAIIR